jgi:hypothetical protein
MQSEYSLTKMPTLQNDLENDYIELKSDNAVLGNTIRHHYRQTNSFVNLSDSYFEINFSITGAARATKTLVNHVGSLFRRATLKIGAVTVEQVENLNHVLLLSSMVKYSNDYAQSTGSNLFYYHDTGIDTLVNGNLVLGGAATNTPLVGNADATAATEHLAYNSGYVYRLERTKGGLSVSCRVPMHEFFQFCSVDKVMYGQEFECELVRADLVESLFGTGNDAGITVDKVSIWVNKRVPDRETELAFLGSISAGLNYDYNFLYQTGFLTGGLQTGQNQLRITTQSEKLISAFVMLCPAAWTQTDSKTRSIDGVDAAEIILNNVRFPVRKYENLALESGKSRTYHQLTHMLTGGDLQSGLGLTRDEYDRSTIIPFNFSAQQNLTGGPSVIELNLNLNAAGNNARAIVILVSEKTVQMSYAGANAVVSVM